MEPTLPQPHAPQTPQMPQMTPTSQGPASPVATLPPSSGMSRAQDAVGAWARTQLPRMWWKVALAGIIAWVVVNGVASGAPGGPILALDLLLGAALMPFCFLLYWYEECGEAKLPPTVLGLALVAGGTVGLVSGAVIEGVLTPASNWPGAVIIGIAEEAAKALAILIIARYAYAQVPHRLHGLLVGVAVGAGFAAVETLGYGLNALLQASQQVDLVSALNFANQELLSRMVLSPFGHVAWAGIMGAAIWRERRSNQFVLDQSVIQAFVVVVVLHALWDGSLFAGWPSIGIGALSLPILDTFIVGPLGLATLAFFVYEARTRERQASATPLPPLFDALRTYYRSLGVSLGIISTGPRLASAPALPLTQRATVPPTPPQDAIPPTATPTATPQAAPLVQPQAPMPSMPPTQAPAQPYVSPAAQPIAQPAAPRPTGVYCPQCGTHNAVSAKFCINCGGALPVLPNG